MPVNNFTLQAVKDAVVTALATALPGVIDGSGNKLGAIVSSYEATYDEFLKNASKGDGRILCWIHNRSMPDTPVCLGKVFKKDFAYRIRVAYDQSARQEIATDIAAETYLANIRKQIYDTCADNIAWSGNCLDSWIKDEQESAPFKPPLKGLELTLGGYFWYNQT